MISPSSRVDMASFALELLIRIAVTGAIGAVAGAFALQIAARMVTSHKLRYGMAYRASFAAYAAAYGTLMGGIILLGSSSWVLVLGVAAGVFVQAAILRGLMGPPGTPRPDFRMAGLAALAHAAVGVSLYRLWELWAFGAR